MAKRVQCSKFMHAMRTRRHDTARGGEWGAGLYDGVAKASHLVLVADEKSNYVGCVGGGVGNLTNYLDHLGKVVEKGCTYVVS